MLPFVAAVAGDGITIVLVQSAETTYLSIVFNCDIRVGGRVVKIGDCARVERVEFGTI